MFEVSERSSKLMFVISCMSSITISIGERIVSQGVDVVQPVLDPQIAPKLVPAVDSWMISTRLPTVNKRTGEIWKFHPINPVVTMPVPTIPPSTFSFEDVSIPSEMKFKLILTVECRDRD
jgi:hypothetical protein